MQLSTIQFSRYFHNHCLTDQQSFVFDSFQQTRNKALELSKDAIVNVREGITAVTESET